MTLLVIGTPGQGPRSFFTGEATDELRAGEVALPVEAVGDYIIAADGLSVLPRPQTLADSVRVKQAQLAELASGKLDLWEGGTAPTGGLQVDDTSTGRLDSWATMALVSKLGSTAFGLPYWIMADNSHHAFTSADDFLTFAAAAAAYKTGAILHNGALKTAINTAETPEALAAIDITAGWPN